MKFRLLKTLFAVFLIATATAQTPPEKKAMRRAEAWRIDQERECLHQTQMMLERLSKDLRRLARTLTPGAARSAPVIIGWPTLTAQPIIIMQPPIRAGEQ